MKKIKTIPRLIVILLAILFCKDISAQIDLSIKNQAIRDIIPQIEKSSGYNFFYSSGLEGLDIKKDLTAKDISLEEVLNKLLANTSITYQIKENNQVLLIWKNISQTSAQDFIPTKKITGIILDEEGDPVIGANIVIKGTTIGVISDIEGQFSIEAPEKAVLQISFIGYTEKTITIGRESYYKITLSENLEVLTEVVVTALGITREKKGLGYAVQQIKSESLETPSPNLVSQLSGKVAGLNINSGAVAGAGSRISIRGERALSAGPSSPLFVIDGIPIGSGAGSQTGAAGINELSPNDIESVNVLKGAAASALYGSRAANGAIIVTTKSGKKQSGLGVSYSGTFSRETPLILPQLQDQFGQGSNGIYEGSNFGSNSGYYRSGQYDDYDESWGPRFMGQKMVQFDSPTTNGYRAGDTFLSPEIRGEAIPTEWVGHPNNLKDFFHHGSTRINNVALSNSTNNMNFRISYTNTKQEGLTPNNDINRHVFNLNTSMEMNKWISVDAVANYTKTKRTNVPSLGYGSDVSPMYYFCWMPISHNINSLKDYWQRGGLEGTRQFQNLGSYNNIYFTMYEMLTQDDMNRFFGKLAITINPVKDVSVMLRGGSDNSWGTANRKESYYKKDGNGFFRESTNHYQENNFDFLVNYNPSFGELFGLTINFGGNRMERFNKSMNAETRSLIVPHIYSFANAREQPTVGNSTSKKIVNSLFGSVLFDYKRKIFAEVTARNDWSSTLPPGSNSYFYPSVTLSALISEIVQLPSLFNYAKIRGSYASVGNDTDPYSLYNTYSLEGYWNNSPMLRNSGDLLNSNLKPAMANTWEVGAELFILKNRLSIDFSYYNTRTKDQIINLQSALTSGYSSRKINSGETENKGFEFIINATPVQLANSFQWDLSFNFSRSRTYVINLAEGMDELILTSGNLEDAKIVARPGERMGQIFGTAYKRVEEGPLKGQPVLDSAGQYVTDSDIYLGNVNPDWIAGVSTGLSYKGLSLHVLFDIRQGGYFISRTLNKYVGAGMTIESLEGRGAREPGKEYDDLYYSEGAILVDGEYQQNLQIFDGTYSKGIVGNDARRFIKTKYDHITEAQMTDASFVKLRELRLAYVLPKKWSKKVFMENISLAFVGRDLFLWTKNPHVDPESGGMDDFNLGVDAFSVPSSKSLGFQINVSF